MHKSDCRVKGLGEVSIRLRDLDAMNKFYEEVMGLEVLRRDEGFVFFKVGRARSYYGRFYPLHLCTLVHTIKSYELRMGS